ncbi:hypothetical protein [Streptomyces sp. NPDC127197]|uniref:hypothetical protein n=1 Tax=Streptomyces sp. NPDC127197 TaxID=3345388 RepID=UPI0036315241
MSRTLQLGLFPTEHDADPLADLVPDKADIYILNLSGGKDGPRAAALAMDAARRRRRGPGLHHPRPLRPVDLHRRAR